MIALAQKKDAIKIAAIHKKEIKQGFLSSLPLVFLEKLYICVIENDFCIVATENNDVIGFVAGTKNINKLYSYFFKKYFLYSAIILLPKILNIKKIFETLLYPKKDDIEPELLTIAVKNEFQGKGVAKEMFDAFVLEMKKYNVKTFKVLVGEDLKPAINFYERNGFKFLKEIQVHKGQKSRIYIYQL